MKLFAKAALVLLFTSQAFALNESHIKQIGQFATFGGPFYTEQDMADDCTERAPGGACGEDDVGPFGPSTFIHHPIFWFPGNIQWNDEYSCQSDYCDHGVVSHNHNINHYGIQYKIVQDTEKDKDCSKTQSGASVIDVSARELNETLPLVGVPFTLEYHSSYQIAYKSHFRIRVPVPTVGTVTAYPNVKMQILDDTSTIVAQQTVSTSSTTPLVYIWDGKNSSGNVILGVRAFTVKIFGVDSSSVDHLFIEYTKYAGTFKAPPLGLGGWVPSIFAFYDVNEKKVYLGNGTSRSVDATLLGSGEYRAPSEDGSLAYEFFSNGKVHRIKSGLTGTTLYTFSYAGNLLSSITGAFSLVTTFGRNGSNELTSITAPYGQVTTTVIGTAGNDTDRLTSLVTPASETYSMSYTSSKLLYTFQKPTGPTSTFAYDSDGLLNTDTHSGGFFWTLTNLTGTTDTKKVQLASYMSRNTVVETGEGYLKTTRPDATETSVTYSSTAATSVDRGVTRTFTYGNDPRWGSQIQILTNKTGDASGASPSTAYADSVTLSTPGNPFSVTAYTSTATLNSKVTTNAFSSSTMKWTVTTPESRTAFIKIDSYERPIEIQQGALTKTEFTYTNEHLTKIKRGVRETDLAYSGTTGLLDTITNPLSEVTTFAYDSAQRVTSVTLPDLRVIGYGYDSTGNLTSVTTPLSLTHYMNWNSQELLGNYQPPAISGIVDPKTYYTYNNDKQLDLITRPDGQAIDYSYDSTTGKLDSVTTDGGATYTTFGYDATTGKANDVVAPNNLEVTRTFSGVMLSGENLVDASGPTNISGYSRSFDSEGRVGSDSVTVGATTKTASYGFDQDNNVITAGSIAINYNSDGLVSDTVMGLVTDQYTYNSFGEITGYQTWYNGTARYSYSLTRDDLGRVTQKVETLAGVTKTFVYTYDSAGRLVSGTLNGSPDFSITWDANGNRTSYTKSGVTTTATYDDQDRVIADTIYNFAYNDNGELVSKTNTLTSAVTTFAYDAFGNLTSISNPGVGSATHSYDGFGRRINTAGTVGRKLVYDADGRVVATLNPSTGAFGKRFVYGSRKNVPDYYIEVSTGDTYRMIYDYLGSLRTVWKVSDGTAIGLAEHDEFGKVVTDGLSIANPFGFAGGIIDPGARTLHFGAREYLPVDGRWLQKDPIRFGGGDTNLYGYVMNDPVNWIDPAGLYFTFANATAQNLYAKTYESSTGLARALLDKIRNDKVRNVHINVKCDGELQKYAQSLGVGMEVDGLTTGNNERAVVNISNIAQNPATLIHEIGHADQLFDGQTGRLSEGVPTLLEVFVGGH